MMRKENTVNSKLITLGPSSQAEIYNWLKKVQDVQKSEKFVLLVLPSTCDKKSGNLYNEHYWVKFVADGTNNDPWIQSSNYFHHSSTNTNSLLAGYFLIKIIIWCKHTT